MLVKPVLPWSFYGKVGWGTCTADPSVPALCQAAGGWLGSLWHSCMKGSELGLHSTGVCLSFCLIAFYHHCVIFLLFHHPGNHLPKHKWFICSLHFFHFLVRTQYLCTKCFSHVLSGFLDQDSCKMFQVASVFEVLRFLNMLLSWFLMEEEIISQHCAMAGCFSCMHKPPT